MDETKRSRWLTLPNVITTVRIIGSPGLAVLALDGRPFGVGVLAVLLVCTEWLDGFLARRWHATSSTGARLDTIADAIFYSSLLGAILILNPSAFGNESYWIATAVTSYLLSWLASWLKFNCLPSYHTWAAKGAWVLVGTGIVCLLSGYSLWPFRGAMAFVALTNLEAICITAALPDCRVDVPSIWHVRCRRNRSHR